MEYQNNTSKTTSKQQQKRKIIWFNPSYSMNISTIRISLYLYIRISLNLGKKTHSNNVLYKENIKLTRENHRNKIYCGISETKFKSRYVNHLKSFKKQKFNKKQKIQNRYWTFQLSLETKGAKQKCWYIVRNSRETSVIRHSNKTMHVMSKRKICNSATQTR